MPGLELGLLVRAVWVHVGETGYGVAVANDATYGHDVTRVGSAPSLRGRPGPVRLSVLRAPTCPDPAADQGRHVRHVSIRSAPASATQWPKAIGRLRGQCGAADRSAERPVSAFALCSADGRRRAGASTDPAPHAPLRTGPARRPSPGTGPSRDGTLAALDRRPPTGSGIAEQRNSAERYEPRCKDHERAGVARAAGLPSSWRSGGVPE